MPGATDKHSGLLADAISVELMAIGSDFTIIELENMVCFVDADYSDATNRAVASEVIEQYGV